MSSLAVANNRLLNLEQFKIANFFYTDSYLFKRIIITERSLEVVEFLTAIVLTLLFLPICIFLALAIKIQMGGSVLYTQTRVGRNGALFKIYKFRSMIENAEKETGPILATRGDQRITGLGKILRASHLDELPQLINVLKREMSFVGPRPERPEFVERFEKDINRYTRRREVKPGITGLAQICLPYDATAEQKLEYDLYFIDNRTSIIFSLIISYYTVLKMLTFFKN